MNKIYLQRYVQKCKRIYIYQFTITKKPHPKYYQSIQFIHSPMSLLINCLQVKQSLFMFLQFLQQQDLEQLYQAILSKSLILSNENQNILLSFIFSKKYCTKVDRSMSYFMYQNQVTKSIDTLSVLNIASNSSTQALNIITNFNFLFKELQSKCGMINSQVLAMQRIVTEPDLPLPISMRSNIGKYCSSNFQFFVCSKVAQPQLKNETESDFDDLKKLLADNQQKYIKKILKSNKHSSNQNSILQKIKLLYFNPEKFVYQIQSNDEQSIEDNHIYNFFITIIKITKNLILSIKLRLNSLKSDPYAFFTEFLLRYSIFKCYILQLQDQLGSVVQNFKFIVQDALNVNFGKINTQNQISLWKTFMKMFATQMTSQIQHCLPIYMNLVHKLKVTFDNNLYKKIPIINQLNLVEDNQQFEGSSVLEYLLDKQNIDNVQVFLSDFMEMMVDLSIDENNVLLCGHSQQLLSNLFDRFEVKIVEYEKQILSKIISQLPDVETKQFIEEEFPFLEKYLNVKPRTLRNILIQLDTNLVTIEFQSTDQQLEQINKKFLNQSQQMSSSKKTQGSSITAPSEDDEENETDLQGLQYFSQVDEQQILNQIDI